MFIPIICQDVVTQTFTTSNEQLYCSQALYSTYIPQRKDMSNIEICHWDQEYQKSYSSFKEDMTQDQTTVSKQARDETIQLALRNRSNRKLAFEAAQEAFNINLEQDDSVLAKNIICITNATRNLPIVQLKIVKSNSENLDFYYALGEKRVMQINSSFPRKQDENVIVSLYSDGECVYMNDMPLKELIDDLEKYL